MIGFASAASARPLDPVPRIISRGPLDACLNAPRPRLGVGIVAAVAPNLGPLNMRALPAVDTRIILQLYSGNRLTVISGPSCNRGLNWWRVENVNGRRGWVAEGDWERYYLLPARDYDRNRIVDPVVWSCPPERRIPCAVP